MFVSELFMKVCSRSHFVCNYAIRREHLHFLGTDRNREKLKHRLTDKDFVSLQHMRWGLKFRACTV